MEKETIPTLAFASSDVRSADREELKALATAAAVTVQGECSHCGGSGRSDETAEKVVHCFGPSWFGTQWDLARLHAAIDSADHIRWVNDPGGHDLVVLVDGEPYRFQVQRPAQQAGSAA